MGDTNSYKNFFEHISEFIVASILMIWGYLYSPLELIEKYRYAMPKEIGLLIFSTVTLIFFLSLTIGTLNKRRKNQESISNKNIPIIFAFLSILSLFFFLYTGHNLQITFLERNDPLFNYFLENYFIYMAIYIFLVAAIPTVFDNLPSIVTKIFNIIQKYH